LRTEEKGKGLGREERWKEREEGGIKRKSIWRGNGIRGRNEQHRLFP